MRLLLSPALAFVLLQGCTDLEESPTSVITPDNFFQTEAEILGSLASVYAVLRNTTGDGYFMVSNGSSDEEIIPTRGSDWDDGGKWLELQRHTWTPVSMFSNPDALSKGTNTSKAQANHFTSLLVF